MTDTRKHEQFGAKELAICLSHYDLGIIHDVKEFARGSRRAPKAVISSELGQYLFKRRAKERNDIRKVAFTHQIQLSLAEQNFPLPHLLGTRDDNNSMLLLGERIYEMQEFIVGTGYDGSLRSTEQGGHTLGLFHKLLEDFETEYTPPQASYHNAKAIHQSILKTATTLTPKNQHQSSDLQYTVKYLEGSYRHAVEQVNGLGLGDWPLQIVHGDWHPGNMLFRDQLVVAVIDYDTARRQQRAIDFANGALQFSILGGDGDPINWPKHLDMKRFHGFLRGYDEVNVISTDELRAVPYLMCEAMISEAVLPIASTGMFGRYDGKAFLQMIHRKVDWIFSHVEELCDILAEKQEHSDVAQDDKTEVGEDSDSSPSRQ